MHVLFVVNPISGGKTKKLFLKRLHRYITMLEHSYELYFTTRSLIVDSERLTEILDTKKFDRVIAVGGDGTVRLVARNLVFRNVGMAIIPFGSANGMARELQLPLSVGSALQCAIESTEKHLMDILLINERYYCFHLCDVGTNALLVNKHHMEKGRGLLGYAKNIYRSIKESRKFKSYISIEDQSVKLEGYNLTIANARKYGIGTVINTVGRTDDGKFEIVSLKNVKLTSLLQLVSTVFFEERINNLTDVYSVSEANIVFSSSQPIHIDGEPLNNVDKLSIRTIPQAIQFFR